MTPESDLAGRPPLLDLDERVALLRALADGQVELTCLDRQFRPVESPAVLASVGFSLADRSDGPVERPLDRVHPDDHAQTIGLLGVARRAGAAAGPIRFDDDEEPTYLHVVDMVDAWEVMVFVRGGEVSLLDGVGPSASASRPRRMVQHRDAAATITWVDDNSTILLGWDRDEMVGLRAAELVHPEDLDRAVEGWLEMLAGHESEPIRLRYRNASGQHRWFEVHNQNLLSDPAFGYVESELIDIDAEMMALARVRDSELQFAGLAESLPVGVLQFGEQGEVVFANRWIHDLTGCNPRTIGSLSWLGEDERADLAQQVSEALEHGTDGDSELAIVAADGREHVCRLRLRSLASSSGQRGAIASVEDITASLQLQQRLRTQALTDPLTLLPNRRALHDWLVEQAATGPVALLFLDLDQFKVINDALGHDVGDEFLVGVSEQIRRAVRPGDFVARLGGDEFVVGCVGVTNRREAADVADRLLEILEQPILVGSHTLPVGCSVGIAIDHSGQPPAGLVSDADLAMYEAKRAGGRQYVFYDEAQRLGVQHELRRESDLRSALERNEFELFAQPIVELATGGAIGFETLIRWHHPDEGTLLPARFIPTTERTGLIHPIGAWIIDEACRHSAALRAAGMPARISVNVSPFQLSAPGFTKIVVDGLTAHGVEPTDLVLEVTETVFLDTDAEVLATIGALVDLGVRIALDDFGTGCSSLNHLRLLPSQMVKIDRSFTAEVGVDHESTAILEVMVDLADRLGQQLVVEGIETAEQAEILQAMGVRYGQGYLYGRPAPVPAVLDTCGPAPSRS